MDRSNPPSVATDTEKGDSTPSVPSITERTKPVTEETFLTGLKLYVTLGSVVIVGFLITLDSSIVVTVRMLLMMLFY